MPKLKAMPGRAKSGHAGPLLCELHAHTTWSDGLLSLRQLVDLYGAGGFDVLAITDHVVRVEDPWFAAATGEAQHVHPGNHAAYLAELDAEAERARELYSLLVVPGLELTYNDADPTRAAHAVAIGLRSFVPVDTGIEPALAAARAAGAALVAAHPYPLELAGLSTRTTARFAEEAEWAASVVDRFELVNRHELFPWVAAARLPVVASGDFHRLPHFATWKTLVPAAKSAEALVEYLRSDGAIALTRLDREPDAAAIAA